ncbi:hypothetical protein G6541_31285, partial [Streptomyces albidoflavus]|nr:hypothetical protein [Streptomyces albidoflavus]
MQGRVQGEFLHAAGADLVTRAHGEFQEGRPGDHDLPAHDMVGEPGVGGEREAPGQDGAPAARQGDGRREQGVVSRGQTEVGGVAGRPRRRTRLGPVPLVLEGVGGQGDAAGVGEDLGPVRGHSSDVQLGERGQQPVQTAVVAPQRAHGEGAGGRIGVLDGLLDAQAHDRVRARLDEDAVAVA